jgi:hypothetical protein
VNLGPSPFGNPKFHVLMPPDFERADRTGEFWGYPESRAFAELLIDCEEDRTLRRARRHAAGAPAMTARTHCRQVGGLASISGEK